MSSYAKICFCKRKQGYSDKFNLFCSDIKENFLGGSKRVSHLQRNLLNSARDLYYLRFAESCLDQEISDGRVDPWLVTMDRKLFRTSEAFHHLVLPDGTRTCFLSIDRPRELSNQNYWTNVDRISDNFSAKRIKSGIATKPLTKNGMSKIVTNLDLSINDMQGMFDPRTIFL